MKTSTPPMKAKPTTESSLEETRDYLDQLRKTQTRISIRELIGFWGARGRGPFVMQTINSDLAEMKLEADPPIDAGNLDLQVSIRQMTDTSVAAPDAHLLTLAQVPAASFALTTPSTEELIGVVEPDTSLDEATTMMLRHDYSQLLVVGDITKRNLVGVISWKLYATARLRREDPTTVSQIMQPVTGVDLHSDLFSSIGPVVKYDFVAVTYRGSLSGIVTTTDLTEQFEELAVPFLAVGRAEQELRRVARIKFRDIAPETIEQATLGRLQHIYREHWEATDWSLSQSAFDDWVNSTRELRNSIAHFDDAERDIPAQLRAVHQLSAWLRGVRDNVRTESPSSV
jgi:CBS domain-containing protein